MRRLPPTFVASIPQHLERARAAQPGGTGAEPRPPAGYGARRPRRPGRSPVPVSGSHRPSPDGTKTRHGQHRAARPGGGQHQAGANASPGPRVTESDVAERRNRSWPVTVSLTVRATFLGTLARSGQVTSVVVPAGVFTSTCQESWPAACGARRSRKSATPPREETSDRPPGAVGGARRSRAGSSDAVAPPRTPSSACDDPSPFVPSAASVSSQLLEDGAVRWEGDSRPVGDYYRPAPPRRLPRREDQTQRGS